MIFVEHYLTTFWKCLFLLQHILERYITCHNFFFVFYPSSWFNIRISSRIQILPIKSIKHIFTLYCNISNAISFTFCKMFPLQKVRSILLLYCNYCVNILDTLQTNIASNKSFFYVTKILWY